MEIMVILTEKKKKKFAMHFENLGTQMITATDETGRMVGASVNVICLCVFTGACLIE